MSPPRVAVAASGGRDSTALLHCTVRCAAPLGIEVVALHVHHGLMPQADGWLAQVRGQSRRWGAAFVSERVQGSPPPGASVEAWARRERYGALGRLAREAGCGLVLLAHHRRDQAETWLLQALRSGGPAGLAAMPARVARDGVTWARPWLDLPRPAIEAYVRRHRLAHVDDASNTDPRFARNRLRLQVWPALIAAFPDAETALTGAALRAQEAAALASEAAALDLPALRQGSALAVAPWRMLPPARRRNALRAWLARTLSSPLPESLLQRLVAELPARPAGRWPAPDGELRLYRGALTLHDAPLAPATAAPPVTLDLSQPGRQRPAGWCGHFEVMPVREGGLPPDRLAAVVARERAGGERFRLAEGGAARSLKKQYQSQAVPAWQRHGPLLCTPHGRLLFAPGLGVEATARAAAGQPQLGVSWVPDPPVTAGPRRRAG